MRYQRERLRFTDNGLRGNLTSKNLQVHVDDVRASADELGRLEHERIWMATPLLHPSRLVLRLRLGRAGAFLICQFPRCLDRISDGQLVVDVGCHRAFCSNSANGLGRRSSQQKLGIFFHVPGPLPKGVGNQTVHFSTRLRSAEIGRRQSDLLRGTH